MGFKFQNDSALYDQAIADLTKAIELVPEFAWALMHRGEAYRLKGRYDQAIADLNRAIQIEPNNAWAYAVRGATGQAKGKHQHALADLTEAIRLDRNLAWAYFTRGEVHEANGDKETARADYDLAVHLDTSFKARLEAKLEAGHKTREAAEQAEAERQRRHRPRGLTRRLGGAVFGLVVVGPILGAVAGEVLRLLAVAADWMFGSSIYGWSNDAIHHAAVGLLGDQIALNLAGGFHRFQIVLPGDTNWLMVGGSVLGAAVMAVYGWVGGWYANADRDRAMRLRSAVLGAAIPGLFLCVVVATVLRGVGGVIARPFGWEIGGYLIWMKWGAVVSAIVFWLEGWMEGWSDTIGKRMTLNGPAWSDTKRHFWRRCGSAVKAAAIGVSLGVVVATVLRAVAGLVAWPFGWEVGGWLVWIGWAAMILGAFMAVFGWNEDM